MSIHLEYVLYLFGPFEIASYWPVMSTFSGAQYGHNFSIDSVDENLLGNFEIIL